MQVPGVLVNCHASFSWGVDLQHALNNAVVIEEIAKIAYRTFALQPSVEAMDQTFLDRHFLRKHGIQIERESLKND